MNYLFRLSPAILLMFLLIGCADNTPQDNNYKLRKASCLAPEAIGVGDYITTMNQMDGISFIWNKVDGALGYEFQMYVNNGVNPSIASLVGIDTSFSVVSIFQIDDLITAKVRTICDDRNAVSDWTDIEIVNRNGGAVVEDIPGFAPVDWNAVCENTSCEYIRFIDNQIMDCEGDIIELDLGQGRKSFYLKSDICPCIFESELCYGLENIQDCLHTPYLKRNYTSCGE